MLHSLKIFLVVGMVLALYGACPASSSAAEFHCSVEPCRWTARQDGTGKTAHQVIAVGNAAGTESVFFTCEESKSEGTSSTKTSSTNTLENISYSGCTVNGSPGVAIVMNGCKYKFSSAGAISITGCNVGKKIEVQLEGCTFTIGEQLATTLGLKYHTIGASPNREVTSEMTFNFRAVADGTSVHCRINPSQELFGSYSTGNTITTAETTSGVMADGWFG